MTAIMIHSLQTDIFIYNRESVREGESYQYNNWLPSRFLPITVNQWRIMRLGGRGVVSPFVKRMISVALLWAFASFSPFLLCWTGHTIPLRQIKNRRHFRNVFSVALHRCLAASLEILEFRAFAVLIHNCSRQIIQSNRCINLKRACNE